MTPELNSILANFEPMLGICFALNLAYVGLERFRYRMKIQRYASRKYNGLENTEDADEIWMQSVRYLAQTNKTQLNLKNNGISNESWCWWYNAIYSKDRDLYACSALSFLAALLIGIGVSHLSGVNSYLGWAFTKNQFHIWWWIIATTSMIPLFSVYFGRKMVEGAKEHIDLQISKFEKTRKTEVGAAKVKNK